MNQYEIAILYHPDLEVDLSKAEDRIKKIITDNGGKIISTDNWGKRKLAYIIKGNEHAVYVFYSAELPSANIAKVENTLNITSEVIRHLITRPDLKAIAKAERLKAEKAENEQAQEEENAEEEEEEE